jgi:hypothetical protein
MPDHSETEDINDDLLVSSKRAAPIDQRQLADEATKRRKELPLLQRIVKHSSTSSRSITRAKIAWSAPSSKAPSRILRGRPQGWASASRRTRSCITGTCSRPPTNRRSRSSATMSPPSRSSASDQGHSPALPRRLRQRHPGDEGSDQDEKSADLNLASRF